MPKYILPVKALTNYLLHANYFFGLVLKKNVVAKTQDGGGYYH